MTYNYYKSYIVKCIPVKNIVFDVERILLLMSNNPRYGCSPGFKTKER